MITHTKSKSEAQRKNQEGKYKCNECFRTFSFESDLKNTFTKGSSALTAQSARKSFQLRKNFGCTSMFIKLSIHFNVKFARKDSSKSTI
jgi:hypothetical protein